MAKVLVVDDEEHIRLLYTEALAEEGHQVSTAVAGHTVLQKIGFLHPEVVVLDIRLDDCNGLDLLQDIRQRHYDLPVILCTAYDTYRYDPKALAADYYVVKSSDLSELKRKIQQALEGRPSA